MLGFKKVQKYIYNYQPFGDSLYLCYKHPRTCLQCLSNLIGNSGLNDVANSFIDTLHVMRNDIDNLETTFQDNIVSAILRYIHDSTRQIEELEK